MTATTEVKLTAEQKAEQKFLASTFKGQLTEAGLKNLRERFPADLVVDMKDEDNFKQTRKDRTEYNKLVEDINRRRIDFSTALKVHGDELIGEITSIFNTVLIPFEKENKDRLAKAAAIKAKHEAMIAGQRQILADIRGYVDTAKESEIDDISSLIEAIQGVSVENFHIDLAHEVSKTIKDVNTELTDILMQKTRLKQLQIETEAAEEAARVATENARLLEEQAAAAQAAADEKARLEKEKTDAAAAEAAQVAAEKAAIADRLNKLRMMPLDLTGQSSEVINKKIIALTNFVVPQAEFGDSYQEALAAKDLVIGTLNSMHAQAVQIEEYQAFQAQQAANAKAAEVVEEPVYQEPAIEYQAQDEHHHVQDEPVYQEPIQQEEKAADPQAVLASMGRASDLVQQSKLLTDLQSWAGHYQLHEQAFTDLLATLSRNNVNY